MVQPINILFNYLQKVRLITFGALKEVGRGRILTEQHTRVVLWLYDNTEFRIEAFIIVSHFLSAHLEESREADHL